MKGRIRTWIAPATVASVSYQRQRASLRATNQFALDLSEAVFTRLAFAAFGVGAVIVARQSQNVIGWCAEAPCRSR